MPTSCSSGGTRAAAGRTRSSSASCSSPASKNEEHESCFLDVAWPLHEGQRDACLAIAETRKLPGRTGFVLPHIDSNGVIDIVRPLGYGKYVRQLRQAMVNPGMGQAPAQKFAG